MSVMRELVWAHTLTNLRFFARSRLILGFALVVTALWSVGLVPFFLSESSGQRFNVLKEVASQLHFLGWFGGAGLGLFAHSSHLRNGTTRLLFSRPAPPELWIASVFLASFLVSLAIHAVAALATLVLSTTWGVPYQLGFVYLAIEAVLESMIVIALLTALASCMHPVLAALLTALANDSMLYFLILQIESSVKANGTSWWTTIAGMPVQMLYAAAPMLDPFQQQTIRVAATLRLGLAEWGYLAATAGYTLVAVTFFFCVSALAVRRRSMP
jgi:ABC-type transport system involved in multi-copper enzyme maturation permease subunit